MFQKRKKNFRRKFKRKTKADMFATRRYVKKELRKDIETKYTDYSNGLTPDENGVIIDLTGTLTQNITDTTRVGDKVTLRSILISGIVNNDTSAVYSSIIRIIIFQWYPNTTLATPLVAGILQSVATTIGCISPYVNDYRNQFGVLYDRTFTMVSTAATDVMFFRKKLSMKYVKKTLQFTTSTTQGSNKIYLLAISDRSANEPGLNFYSRIFYDDA